MRPPRAQQRAKLAARREAGSILWSEGCCGRGGHTPAESRRLAQPWDGSLVTETNSFGCRLRLVTHPYIAAVLGCPGGTNENSPPIHRWVQAEKRGESRQGRQAQEDIKAVLSSLAGLLIFRRANPALKRWAIFFRPCGALSEPFIGIELQRERESSQTA